MTPQQQLKLVELAKQVQWQYRLDQFQDAALKQLLNALSQAQHEVLAKIEDKAYRFQWEEDRALALLDEYSDLQLAIKAQLGQSVLEITGIAGAEAYLIHNDILSFGGKVVDFNNVALTSEQIQAMLTDTPVGGRILSEWVETAFKGQTAAIRQEVMAGMLQGEGYPGLVKRFAQGWEMTKDEATTLVRSYVQTINTDASLAVAKANAEIMKGWKWQSATENGTFYTKSGNGRGRGICLICLSLDAKDEIYPLDGGPELPAHPRCRCFRSMETKSWRDLGIPIDEIEKAARPYTVRGKGIDAETGEIIPQSVGTGGRDILSVGTFMGDYQDWLKNQSAMVQKMTLGPRRLELWQTGKIKGLGELVAIEGGKARLLTLKELQ